MAAITVFAVRAAKVKGKAEKQQKAFQRGLNRFSVADAELLSKADCSNPAFKKALSMLDQMEMRWKREFLNACAMTIEADGVVTEDEAFLRYGIAAALGIYA